MFQTLNHTCSVYLRSTKCHVYKMQAFYDVYWALYPWNDSSLLSSVLTPGLWAWLQQAPVECVHETGCMLGVPPHHRQRGAPPYKLQPLNPLLPSVQKQQLYCTLMDIFCILCVPCLFNIILPHAIHNSAHNHLCECQQNHFLCVERPSLFLSFYSI